MRYELNVPDDVARQLQDRSTGSGEPVGVLIAGAVRAMLAEAALRVWETGPQTPGQELKLWKDRAVRAQAALEHEQAQNLQLRSRLTEVQQAAGARAADQGRVMREILEVTYGSPTAQPHVT